MFTTQRNHGMVSSNDNNYQDVEYRGSRCEEAVQSLSSFPTDQITGHQAPSSLKLDVMATLTQLMPNVQSSVPATGQMGNLQQSGSYLMWRVTTSRSHSGENKPVYIPGSCYFDVLCNY